MKYLMLIFLMFFMLSGQFLLAQTIQKIKLTEYTRGFQKEIILSENNFEITRNSETKHKKVTDIQWKKIQKIVQNISLEKLSTYVPPSSKRASDGALHTVLEIQAKEKTFHSQTFDNDNPPKELKALVQALGKF